MQADYASAKKPVPFPTPVYEIDPLAKFYDAPYDILFRTCYLFGIRIGEALKLAKSDFNYSKDSGRDVLIAAILTEKNKRTPLRHLPIMIGGDLSPFQQEEAKIAKYLLEYLNSLTEKNAPLFPRITRQMAYNKFCEQTIEIRAIQLHPERRIITIPEFKIRPHYLRHCRLTHVVEEYNYDPLTLMQYAGWTDVRPASFYLQLTWQHLAKQMISKH